MLPIKERARILVEQMKVSAIQEINLPENKAAFIYGVIPKENKFPNIEFKINYDPELIERIWNGGI